MYRILLEFRIAYTQWALREIDPSHPDVGALLANLSKLEDARKECSK
jgi:hypothetical protein